MSKRRAAAQAEFMAIRSLLPPVKVDFESRPYFASLVPPETFSIQDNYRDTLAFVLDMRQYFWSRRMRSPDGLRRQIFADFAKIKSIEPAAGLVLAAEIDRWRLSSGKQPRMWDEEWHPDVKRFFVQAGLFELLGVPAHGDPPASEAGSIETIKFVQGRSVDARTGSAMRDQIEHLCGRSIGPRRTVYDAIAEAIANTRHAYPPMTSIWPVRTTGRWWASGSWDRATNTVAIHLYDQGVGIPRTLPRSEHWSDVLKMTGLGERLHPERSDARMIEAALEIGRTSTGSAGRGKGLAEMAAWIEKLGAGFLRIRSGRGVVVYRPDGSIEGRNRTAPFPGTLIEWEIGFGD